LREAILQGVVSTPQVHDKQRFRELALDKVSITDITLTE
jgi:hypothetical protein